MVDEYARPDVTVRAADALISSTGASRPLPLELYATHGMGEALGLTIDSTIRLSGPNLHADGELIWQLGAAVQTYGRHLE